MDGGKAMNGNGQRSDAAAGAGNTLSLADVSLDERHYNGGVTEDRLAPTHCGERGTEQHEREGVAEISHLLHGMGDELVMGMIKAREAELNIHKAFPGGDQRFQDAEDDDDDDDDFEYGASARGNEGHAEGEDEEEEGDEVEEEEEEEESDDNQVVGLFDDTVDKSPHAALKRARDQYGLDLVAEMDAARLDILARIKVVNWIRTLVRARKQDCGAVVRQVRDVLSDARGSGNLDGELFGDDSYLKPVLADDLLLTALEK